MKGTASTVFVDKIHGFLVVKSLNQSNNVFVIHLFKNFDFPSHALPSLWLEQIEFVVNLHSHFLACQLVDTNSYDCICPLPNSFSNEVIVQTGRRRSIRVEGNFCVVISRLLARASLHFSLDSLLVSHRLLLRCLRALESLIVGLENDFGSVFMERRVV